MIRLLVSNQFLYGNKENIDSVHFKFSKKGTNLLAKNKILFQNFWPELSNISEQKIDKFAHCAIALCSPMLRKRLLTILVYYIVTPHRGPEHPIM